MFNAKQEESMAWVTIASIRLLAARALSLIRNHCQKTVFVCRPNRSSEYFVLSFSLTALPQTVDSDLPCRYTLEHLDQRANFLPNPALLFRISPCRNAEQSNPNSAQWQSLCFKGRSTSLVFLPIPNCLIGQFSGIGHRWSCLSQGYSCTQTSMRLSASLKFCRFKSSVNTSFWFSIFCFLALFP